MSPSPLPAAVRSATWAAQSAARTPAAKSLTRKDIDRLICIQPTSCRHPCRWRAARPDGGTQLPSLCSPCLSSIEVQRSATREWFWRMRRAVVFRLREPVRAHARPTFVNRQECASLEVLTVRFECPGDDVDGRVGQQVLSSDLHNARRGSSAGREDCREVQVVRDEDELMLVRPRQDLDVRRSRSTDR